MKRIVMLRQVTRLRQVYMVSDTGRGNETVRSTAAMINQIVELWEMLVAVHEQAEEHFRLRPESVKLWRGYLESRLLRDPDARIVVAMEEQKVLGFLVARIEHPAPMISTGVHGFVSDCFVRPEYRRQGIATALFAKATAWLADRDITELQLDVYNRNAEAMEYWQARGFRPLKTRMVKTL